MFGCRGDVPRCRGSLARRVRLALAFVAAIPSLAAAGPAPWLDSADDIIRVAQAPIAAGFLIRGLPSIGLFQLQPIFAPPLTERYARFERYTPACSGRSPNDHDDTGIKLPAITLPSLALPPLCGGPKAAANPPAPGTPCPAESFDIAAENCSANGDTFVVRAPQWIWLGDPLSQVMNTLRPVAVRTPPPSTQPNPFRWK